MSLSDSDERVITEGEITSCREQMIFTTALQECVETNMTSFTTSYDIKRDMKKKSYLMDSKRR